MTGVSVIRDTVLTGDSMLKKNKVELHPKLCLFASSQLHWHIWHFPRGREEWVPVFVAVDLKIVGEGAGAPL